MLARTVMLYVYWILTAVVLAIIFLRIWLIMKRKVGQRERRPNIQDVLLFLAWALMVVTGVMATLAVSYSDQIENLLTNKGRSKIMKVGYISYITSIADLTLTKAALLSIFFQSRQQLSNRMRMFLYFVTGYIAVGFVVTFFWSMFWCGANISNNWISKDSLGSICLVCVQLPVMSTLTAVNVSTDMMLMLMGWLVIRPLNMNNRRSLKAALLLVFSVGTLSLAASFVRFSIMASTPFTNVIRDFGLITKMESWFGLELACAVVACSLPTVRALLRQIPKKNPAAGSSYSSGFRSSGNSRKFGSMYLGSLSSSNADDAHTAV